MSMSFCLRLCLQGIFLNLGDCGGKIHSKWRQHHFTSWSLDCEKRRLAGHSAVSLLLGTVDLSSCLKSPSCLTFDAMMDWNLELWAKKDILSPWSCSLSENFITVTMTETKLEPKPNCLLWALNCQVQLLWDGRFVCPTFRVLSRCWSLKLRQLDVHQTHGWALETTLLILMYFLFYFFFPNQKTLHYFEYRLDWGRS